MEKVPYEKLRNFNRRAIGLAMAAVSIFMAGSSSENTPPRLPEGTKWVAGGDSFTSGHAGLERESIYASTKTVSYTKSVTPSKLQIYWVLKRVTLQMPLAQVRQLKT